MRTGFRDETVRNILMRSREKLLNFSRRGSRVESEKLGDHQRELPGGVEVEVKTLSVLEPEEEIDAGLNDAEAPAGSPLTLSETEPPKTRVPVAVAV
jgi:hypothetical protein